MKVNGMDASTTAYTASQTSDAPAREPKMASRGGEAVAQDASQQAKPLMDASELLNLSSFEKRELPISEKVVLNAIEKANKAILISNRKFEYSIHEKTKEIMIKVIDSDTNEVIREIPPEKTLDMVARMWEMAGIIVDERR